MSFLFIKKEGMEHIFAQAKFENFGQAIFVNAIFRLGQFNNKFVLQSLCASRYRTKNTLKKAWYVFLLKPYKPKIDPAKI